MKINEKLIGIEDYIIETGKNDNWQWRKWKSGRIELTGTIQYTNLSITTASMGTYYGAEKNSPLPFNIKELYYLGYSECAVRSSGVFVYNTSVENTTLKTEFRAHASSVEAKCNVRYYIIGKISQ